MLGTFSQIYVQVVFAVKNRRSLIDPSWEDAMYRYISGIVQKKGQKLMIANGTRDHIHLLIGIKPSCCLSDLVREIKKSSNEYIKEMRFTKYKFEWQEGYGAFSYSYSAIDQVFNYIKNQKAHHRKKRFKEEYCELLKEAGIQYKEEFLFDWVDERDPSGSKSTKSRFFITVRSLRDRIHQFLPCYKSLTN